MDWWVHGIGADRTFKQLMDAGGRSRSNPRRGYAIVVVRLLRHEMIGVVVMTLMMMMMMDLFLVQ